MAYSIENANYCLLMSIWTKHNACKHSNDFFTAWHKFFSIFLKWNSLVKRSQWNYTLLLDSQFWLWKHISVFKISTRKKRFIRMLAHSQACLYITYIYIFIFVLLQLSYVSFTLVFGHRFCFQTKDSTCCHGLHLHAILRIISRGVSGLATDAPWVVWGGWWTTCLLHDSRLFGFHAWKWFSL